MMKTDEIMILAVAGLAAYMVLKTGGVLGTGALKLPGLTNKSAFETAWDSFTSQPWYTYNYANDASGSKFSATGADVRARR
jgi:hypothetical protein